MFIICIPDDVGNVKIKKFSKFSESVFQSHLLTEIRFAYNNIGWRAASLWCDRHLKSDIYAGLRAGALADNRKNRNVSNRTAFAGWS